MKISNTIFAIAFMSLTLSSVYSSESTSELPLEQINSSQDYQNTEATNFIQNNEKQIGLDSTQMIQENGSHVSSESNFGTPLPVELDPTYNVVRTTSKYQMDGLDFQDPTLTGYPKRLVVGYSKEERMQSCIWNNIVREGKAGLDKDVAGLRQTINKEIGEIGQAKEYLLLI